MAPTTYRPHLHCQRVARHAPRVGAPVSTPPNLRDVGGFDREGIAERAAGTAYGDDPRDLAAIFAGR